MNMLPRLKGWKLWLFIVALSSGAAVSIMGVIDLVWRLRFGLAGLAAVCFVVWVFLTSRHDQTDEEWLGS